MSNRKGIKKKHADRFDELIDEATTCMFIWLDKASEYDALLEEGKPDDLILENLVHEANEDYFDALVKLHHVLLEARYSPPRNASVQTR